MKNLLEWERVAKDIGGAPSLLSLVLPDVLEGEAREEKLAEIADNNYRLLEEGAIQRLERGLVLVERTTGCGVRRGILACIDLDEFSPESGKDGMIRALKETDPALVEARLKVRERSVLEFSHAVLSFKDKKDKLMRALEGEELEKIYDFDLVAGGGHIKGYFIPDYIAEDVIRDLMSKEDPCFGVLDGNHALAASKAHWERIKEGLSLQEARNHPARFALAEFVNLLGESVVFEPSGEAPEKSEILAALKAGKRYPVKSFALTESRYPLEGREISYD